MRHNTLRLAALLAGATLAGTVLPADAQPARPAVAASPQADWGVAGDTAAARRSVRITMHDDHRFAPAIIEVGHGETVRLEVRNAGSQAHTVVLGPRGHLRQAQAQAPATRAAAAAGMTLVRPGETGEITWKFTRTGESEFACTVAGHPHAAGMRGVIRVVEPAGHKH